MMIEWLDHDLTTLAFCWRLERIDGVVLGFTSHDRDIVLDGLTYDAAPGMVPSTIERRDSLDPDTMTISGALTSNRITERDLLAGRWDGARLRVIAVDWTQPENQPVFLVRGEFGAVESDGRSFSVELQGATALLDAPVVEETSPECRAELGDARCRVNLGTRQALARVVVAEGASVTVDLADSDYAAGTLRWLDGENAGLTSRVVTSAGAQMTLREPPVFAPAPGTMVLLVQGCDKRFSTCVERFANAANFRGEPHLPGNDLLVRYAK